MGNDRIAHATAPYSNRVCEACHSKTRFHNANSATSIANGGNLNHPSPNAVCTSCHKHNTGFKAACGGCHGNPPVSASFGGDYGMIGGTVPQSNALSAGAYGAHVTHTQTRSMSCDTCHYQSSTTAVKMPNLNAVIDIGFFGFGGKVTSGIYKPYSSNSPRPYYKIKSGTPNTTIATVANTYATANKCSNVYCHGGGVKVGVTQTKQPLAGGTSTAVGWEDIGLVVCGSCHGTDPNNPPNMGSHPKHAGRVCDTCHPTIDAVTHVQGNVRWLFNTSLNRGGTATYRSTPSGTVGNSNDLAPSDPASYGTCTNFSCHSDGKSGPPRVDAQWGSASFGVNCIGCHGGNSTSGAPISTDMHGAHINQLAVNGVVFACAECHSQVVSAGDQVITNRNLHANGGLANYSGAKAGKNKASCNAAYCHTNGKGVAGMAVSWTTGPAISNCNGCHGMAATPGFTAAYGEPNYLSGTAGSTMANSHQRHVNDGALSCNYCHSATVSTTGSLTGINHLDKVIQVSQNATGIRNFTYDGSANNKSCATVMCHGSTVRAFKWGEQLAADCTGCHGMVTLSTGYHPAHNNQLAVNGENYGCVECHAQVVSSNTTFVNRTLHANLQVNYSGARAGKVKTACAAAYCHSDGKGGQGSAVSWSVAGTTFSNCKGCHGVAVTTGGGFTSVYGEPNYASTGTSVSRSNSHKQHVGTSGASTCVYCHNDTVTSTGALKAGKHIDRNVDVVKNTTKSFVYLSAEKSCSAISCHGNAIKYYWGAPESADCSGCHGGNSSTGAKRIVTGMHDQHINNTAFNGTNYGCIECHAQTVSDDRMVKSQDLHGNGFPNYSGAKAGKNVATCNAAYCHSDGKGRLGKIVSWSTAITINKCSTCHGTTTTNGAPDYVSTVEGGAGSNSHNAHVSSTQGNYACAVCHYQLVNSAGTAILPTGKHLDKSMDVAFDPIYSTGTGAKYLSYTCSNISCHGTAQPKWGGPAGAGCTGCHPNLQGSHGQHLGDLFTSGNYVTMYNYTSNKSDEFSAVYRFGCANCHPTDKNKHRNGQVDLDLRGGTTLKLNSGRLAQLNNLNTDASPGYTRGANGVVCLTVYCHSNGKDPGNLSALDYVTTPAWDNGLLPTVDRCGACHGNPPTYASDINNKNSHYVKNSQMGANGTGTTTETGHMVGIHFQNTYVGNNQNGYLGYSSSGNKAHGNKNISTTIGCYICHSGIVSSQKLDTYTLQAETTSGFRCMNCHKATSTTPLQSGLIVGAKFHVNGVKDVKFPNTTLMSKAQLPSVASVLGWSRPNGYKTGVNDYDTCNLGVADWNPQTKTCTTACHISQPVVWGQPLLRCNGCHVSQ
jgi:predicted CxxxxCH...CXXCH cytochrome family protein